MIPLYSQNKVVEYDADGKSVWEAKINLPTSVFRLPNGNTLVASRANTKIYELNRDGKEIWSYTVENGRPMRVRRR